MQRKCSSVMLLTENPGYASFVEKVAKEYDVGFNTETTWRLSRKLSQDLILCSGKWVERVNNLVYSRVVVILKSNESPLPYLKVGIQNFIFGYKETNQFEYIFNKKFELPVIAEEEGVFIEGDYRFDFSRDEFIYKGRSIYVSRAEKEYLSIWLLSGMKDNTKRYHLWNMRKRFGREFLTEVSRTGELI